MRRHGFVALLVAAAVMVVLAVVVVWRGDRDTSRPPPGQLALPGLAAKLGALGFVRLTRGPMTVNFQAVGDHWVVVEKGNYSADQQRLRRLLLGLAELELVEPKTDRPELLGRLDLDDPANGKSTLVTVQDRRGTLVAQLIVGRRRPNDIGAGEPGVYIRKPGSDQSWLARGAFELGGDALSWLDRRIIDIPPARVASVVLNTSGGDSVVLARTSADLPLALDGLAINQRPKPDDALAAPAGALEALDLDDVRPAAELPVADERASTASFTTFDGLVIGLRLSPPADGNWLAIEVTGYGKGMTEAAALNERLSHWSFRIPDDRAKLLRTKLADLLLPRGS